jgi:TldD protein
VRQQVLAALHAVPGATADLRLERWWFTDIRVRGDRVEHAVATSRCAAVARAMAPGCAPAGVSREGGENLEGMVRRALEISLAVPDPGRPAIPPLPARHVEVNLDPGTDVRQVPLSQKRDLARRAAALVRHSDRRIVDCRVRYEDAVVERRVVTSDGSSCLEWRPEACLTVMAVASEAGTAEHALDSVAVTGAWDQLERWVDGVADVSRRAVALLRARPATACTVPVVLSPRMAAALAHRVAGHLTAADDRADGRAPLPVGTRLAPDFVTLGDDGRALGLRGTAAFDAEAVTPTNTVVVRHGVVVAHLHTRTSAARAGEAATGNARAAAGELPVARPTNTYLASGRGELADLLDGVEDGLYLDYPVAVRLEDGRVAVRAGEARHIRAGRLEEPVKAVTLAGDLPELLGLVDAVAGDFRWVPSASRCARAGVGTVPVSNGAPHVRLRYAPVDPTA